MNLFRTLRGGLSITVLAVVFLFSVAACGGEDTPTPAPDVELGDLLPSAGEKLAAMSTMKFNHGRRRGNGSQVLWDDFQEYGNRSKRLPTASGWWWTWRRRVLDLWRLKCWRSETRPT